MLKSDSEIIKNEYLFSIIIIIQNTNKYLLESIESVINQDIEFNNIQLILINSMDDDCEKTKKICEKYTSQYNNILYYAEKGLKLNLARNLAIKMSKGKYISFLEEADYLSDNACKIVNNFFENNSIDVVAIPIKMINKKINDHYLNYKFKRKRVINIKQQSSYIQLNINSTFIKRNVFTNLKFDTSMELEFDLKLLTQAILKKFRYGVVNETYYFYREKNHYECNMELLKHNKMWYINTLENLHLNIIKYCLDEYKYVPKYIQNLFIEDIKLRIKSINVTVLDKDEYEEYINYLGNILRYIDDSIIFSQKNLNMEYKKYIFYIKHKQQLDGEDTKDFMQKIENDEVVELYYNDILIESLNNKNLYIDILKVESNNLIIEGNIESIFDSNDIKIIMEMNDKQYVAQNLVRKFTDIDENILKSKKIEAIWNVEIPDVDVSNIRFYLKYKNSNKISLKIGFTRSGRLVTKLSKSYYKTGKFIFVRSGQTLVILKSTIKRWVGREFRFLQQLLKMKEYKPLLARLAYYITKPLFMNKKIWIFIDRVDMAGDNAECLFKYVIENNREVSPYFAVNKQSSDYSRIKKFGRVLNHVTYMSKIYYLHADKVISSQVDDNAMNPFGGQEQYYRGLLNYDKVFLQHGIIQSDFTNWLNKYKKDINLFITSTEDEYKSILENDYYYDSSVVKLTGLPRYDYLENRSKKQIVIMPTWRIKLVESLDNDTGIRPYSNTFKDSLYLKSWKKVINDERIINLAKSKEYNIIFKPHPNIKQQIKDFEVNEYVKIADESVSYNSLFCESNLLITDYSSVVYDFAYMRKPIVYYQFDIESMYTEHTSKKGYFDFETMGFGPVCYNHEEVVKNILELINRDCEIELKYVDRINKFFKFNDKNNCKRTVAEIMKMSK